MRATKGCARFTAGRSGRAIGALAIAPRAARNAIGPKKCHRPGSGCANDMAVRSCGAAGGPDIARKGASCASKSHRRESGFAAGTAVRSSLAPGAMAVTVLDAANVITVVRAILRPRPGTTSAGEKAQVKPGRRNGSGSGWATLPHCGSGARELGEGRQLDKNPRARQRRKRDW